MINDTVSVFGGTGFVGTNFCYLTPDCYIQERNNLVPETNNILWLISTMSNYNVFDDLLVDINTNLILLMRMLDNAHKKFGDDFCVNYVSTWFVYGLGETNPVSETSHCNPSGFYSITKYAAEQLLKSFCATFGIKYRILRLANVIGVGDKNTSYKTKALQFMVEELKLGNKVKLYKEVSIRDIIDIRDCVVAIKLVINTGDYNTIYNVGNGEPISVNDFIYKAQELCKTGEVYEVPAPSFHQKVQTREFWMDTHKLKALGYRRKYTYEESLRYMING